MADTKVSALGAASALAGTEAFHVVQSAADAKATATQMKTWCSASPTLVTPTIGVATATSVNKVAITAPASAATLTIADGKTLTVSNTMTLTATDSSTVALGAGGTVSYQGTACFQANNSGAAQTGIVSNTDTKIAMLTEEFDIGSLYDGATNSRWTPPAGKIRISGGVSYSGTLTATSSATIYIYKNGSIFKTTFLRHGSTASNYAMITALDNANGTDYYELWINIVTASGTAAILQSATYSNFCGHMV